MNRALQTERLSLRPFTHEDHAGFHGIWGDPEVIWWGAIDDLEESRDRFRQLVDREAAWPDGVGWLAVRRRGEDAILGDVIVQPAKFVDGIEIGWHFRRDAWGHGYATEAAQAVLDRALAEGVVERMYAIVAIQNDRSLRVVEKLGMRPVKDMEYAGLPHRLFAIDRSAG